MIQEIFDVVILSGVYILQRKMYCYVEVSEQDHYQTSPKQKM